MNNEQHVFFYKIYNISFYKMLHIYIYIYILYIYMYIHIYIYIYHICSYTTKIKYSKPYDREDLKGCTLYKSKPLDDKVQY